MNSKHTYRAVIFDLDGTLVDSIADIADSMNRVLRLMGFPIHSYDEYKYLVGNGIRNLVLLSLPLEKRDKATVDDCFTRMMRDYGLNFLRNTKLYEGIPELLDYLVSNGVKLSVLSNKADEITRKICNALLDKWEFAAILGATDRFPRKPAPDSALFIAECMNVLPREVLYLGDTGIDMATACGAGMLPVGVTWGFRDENELRDNGASVLIDHPMRLPYAVMVD